jgi:hypothetical protein
MEKMNRASRRKMRLTGTYTVQKYDRETGELVETVKAKNDVTAAGKTLFLQLVGGINTDYINQANARLELYGADFTGPPVKTIVGADAAPDHDSIPRQVTWTWSDISIDVYTANRVRLVQHGTSTIFSEAVTNWGTKTTAFNWIFSYSVSISGGSNFTEQATALPWPGLGDFLRCVTGNVSGGDRWTASNTRALIFNADRSANMPLNVFSGPTVVGNMLSYTFQNTTAFTWSHQRVFNMRVPHPGMVLRDGTEPLGTQVSGDTWTWIYQFTI